MTVKPDIEQLQAELVEAVHECEEERARALVSDLNARPGKARALLESMLEDEDALVRHAGAFGLGELGGAASARSLARQLEVEEARGTYDGSSVVEAITQALSRVKSASARAALVRRLERLVTLPRPEASDVNEIACALWRQRHPELIPFVHRSLARLNLPAPNPLHGLLVLLEKSPEQLRAWAMDTTVPVELKDEVLVVLTEEVPESLISTLPAFISLAVPLAGSVVHYHDVAARYCVSLFNPLLLYRERLLPKLPEDTRSALRDISRRLVTATSSMKNALQAAVMLMYVGHREDAALLEAHRPQDATFAEVFDDTIHALRQRQTQQLPKNHSN